MVFGLFQCSKQTTSAPVRLLINKHCPNFMTSMNTSKSDISNTFLRKQVPLPPMPVAQSTSQDFMHLWKRPSNCAVKFTDVKEAGKSLWEAGSEDGLTASLKHVKRNSSRKETKRKASYPIIQNIPATNWWKWPWYFPALHRWGSLDSASEANSPEALSIPQVSLSPRLFIQSECPCTNWQMKPLSENSGTPETAIASLTFGKSARFSLEEVDKKDVNCLKTELKIFLWSH